MKLSRLRKKRGLTQAQLAGAVGVKRSLIARIEAGWERPYPRIRKEISRVLGEPEEKIFK